MAEPQIRDQIIGLLATSRKRGLEGEQTILRWVIASVEVLLEAELERQENRTINRS